MDFHNVKASNSLSIDQTSKYLRSGSSPDVLRRITYFNLVCDYVERIRRAEKNNAPISCIKMTIAVSSGLVSYIFVISVLCAILQSWHRKEWCGLSDQQITIRTVNIFCDTSFNLYQILCCGHLLKWSGGGDSNEW